MRLRRTNQLLRRPRPRCRRRRAHGVVFEEVEEPPRATVFGQVRVLQSGEDVAGAFYWYPSSTHGPGSLPKRFEHAGEVFDLCRIEDAYFGRHRRRPGAGGASDEFKREWFRHFAPEDCRGPGLALAQPLLGRLVCALLHL